MKHHGTVPPTWGAVGWVLSSRDTYPIRPPPLSHTILTHESWPKDDLLLRGCYPSIGEASMGSGISTIEGLGRNGGGARYLYRRRVSRCSDPRTPSNLRPIPRDEGSKSKDYTPPSLVLCNARSIGNKTATMRDFFVSQGIDLACVTETWVREGEVVSLHEITPPGFSILHQSRTVSRGGEE